LYLPQNVYFRFCFKPPLLQGCKRLNGEPNTDSNGSTESRPPNKTVLRDTKKELERFSRYV